MRLIAMSRRRRMPPEYVDTLRAAASVSAKRSSRSSAIAPGSLRCRSRATSTRFSRPVRISSTAANCPVRLMDSRTSAACVGDIEAVDAGRPRVGLEQRGQDLHDRGLARPVGAEQGEDAAPRHVEVHAAQHVQLLVRLLQALHVDRGPAVLSSVGHPALRVVSCGALDGVGQPFPLPVDPLTLRVVLDERLGELHRVVPDDRRGSAFRPPRSARRGRRGPRTSHARLAAVDRPEVHQVPLQRLDRRAVVRGKLLRCAPCTAASASCRRSTL